MRIDDRTPLSQLTVLSIFGIFSVSIAKLMSKHHVKINVTIPS